MPTDKRETAAAIGREVLAPLLTVWAEAAAAWMTAEPTLHGLSVLRDGALAGDALARLAPSLTPRQSQAWLGRRHAAIAAIADADDRENLLNLLVRMRHRPANWAEAATDLDLDVPRSVSPQTPLDAAALPRFWDWLSQPANADRLRRRSAAVRTALLAHLDRQAPPHAPLLLLDVGYAGTVQRCLKRILTLAGRPRPVHGLYLLTSSGIRWAMAGAGLARGILADQGAPARLAALILRHRDVLECLLAPPHGALLDYTADGSALSAPPVEGDADQHADTALIQQAALAAVGGPVDGLGVQKRLLRLLIRPSAAEAALMGGWRHADATALDGARRLDDGPADGDRAHCLWPAAARWRQGAVNHCRLT